MSLKDSVNNAKYLVALAPAVVTDNTAQVTSIIDTQGFNSLEFIVALGTIADADTTVACTISHGDAANLSDAAAVPTDDLIGTLASAGFTFADDGATKKIGYRGIKRYVRATWTPSNNTGNMPIAVVARLGYPAVAAQ